MITWDPEKYKKLEEERGILLDEIAEIILRKDYIRIIKNKSKPWQRIFVVEYKNYIHLVPYVIDEEQNIFIKTAYPSRKYMKLFGKGATNEH
jgi:uncharacterized DUF497 family protein